jgi:hypothetical protein
MRGRKLTALLFIEVAAHGVSDHEAKLVKRFRLRKNGVAEPSLRIHLREILQR